MTPSQVADLLGTLASAGVVALVALVVVRVGRPSAFTALRGAVSGDGAALGGGVAVIGTVGSLWFSKGAHFPPCELCWYQRIAMYPLAVVLPLAWWRGDGGLVRPYAIVLATLGLLVSAWHNVIETFPSIDSGSCDPANPCTLRWVEGLGFWTIPRMAGTAFLLVLAALLLDRPTQEEP